MTARKKARPIRASKQVLKAMELLTEKPKKRKRKTEDGIKRRTGQLRKKGSPVRVCELDPKKGPVEFITVESKKRGRLLHLSFTGATVEFDPYEYEIHYYLGVKETKKVQRERVVISSETIVQELR